MSASNLFENDILELVFQNTAFAGIGDASGLQPAATVGSLHISLHTGNPDEPGHQANLECAYTGYAREAIARSAAGWTVVENNVENAAAITFGACSAGSETATHFGVGTDATGNGKLLFSGALTDSLAISNGITPEFAAGALDVSVD